MAFTLPNVPGRLLIPGEVRYVLEVNVGGRVTRSSELPLAASIDVEEGPALTLSHTYGTPHRIYNAPLDTLGRPVSGFRERQFTISGTSGADFRLGYNGDGNRIFASGFDLFQGLRQFLENYARDHATWEQGNVYRPPAVREPEPVLVLRMLREGEVYACDVSRLRSQRSGVGSFWTYSAQVRAWGPAPALMDPGGLSSVFGTIVQAAKDAAAFVDSMTAYVAYATEVTDQVTYVGGTLLEPIRAVGRLGTQLGVVAQAGQRVTQLPMQLVNATFDAARAGVAACAAFAETFTFGAMTAEVDAFQRDAALELNEAQRTALAYLGGQGVKAATSPSYNASVAGQLNSVATSPTATTRAAITTAVVGAFDTAESLTQRLFGSVDRLPEVLALNGMTDPWTMNDGSPFTAGITILVPATDGVPSTGVVVGPNDLYGTDLALDLVDGSPDFGDLIAPGSEPDDFALVTGTANLDRMMAVRLGTSSGDYGVFPLLGIPLRPGQSDAAVSRADVASRVAEQLLRDPRIAKVTGVQVAVTNADQYTIGVDVVPVVGDGVQVVVPF